MKKIFALLLIFACFKAQGQEKYYYHFPTPSRYDFFKGDSIVQVPAVDTSLFSASKYPGAIMRIGPTLYFSDSIQWRRVGSDTSSTDLSNYFNKTQVQGIVNDTAAAIRADFPTGGGTATDTTSLSNRIDTKLTSTDTTGQWAPKGSYLHPADTVAKWAPLGSVPTDNSDLTNGAGYQTKDSLNAHAATMKFPLIATDSTVSIDTTLGVDSALVTHHQLDSIAGAQTLQSVAARGNTFVGSVSIGKSTSPTHTLDIGGSGQFDGYVNFGPGYGSGGATIDGTGDGQFPTVEAAQITTPDIILSGTITTEKLKNNISGDSVYAPDATGKMTLKYIGSYHALPDVPITDLVGTSYTASLSNKDTIQVITNSSAITVTIPPNSSVAFPVGTVLQYVQGGAGVITFSAGVGVTIGNAHSYTESNGQYSIVALRKIATDTWVLFGDLQ